MSYYIVIKINDKKVIPCRKSLSLIYLYFFPFADSRFTCWLNEADRE